MILKYRLCNDVKQNLRDQLKSKVTNNIFHLLSFEITAELNSNNISELATTTSDQLYETKLFT